MKLVRQWELCSPQQAVYIITDLSSCSAHQPRACPSTVSSLALPSREIFHLLPNCTTRSWTHQTRYSLIITLKTLHHCALYSPQWILYTRAPYDPCTDLSALCKATVGEGGVVLGGGGSRKKIYRHGSRWRITLRDLQKGWMTFGCVKGFIGRV